jgi:hypothetical protein
VLMLPTPGTQPNIDGFVVGKRCFLQLGSPSIGPLDLLESQPHCY